MRHHFIMFALFSLVSSMSLAAGTDGPGNSFSSSPRSLTLRSGGLKEFPYSESVSGSELSRSLSRSRNLWVCSLRKPTMAEGRNIPRCDALAGLNQLENSKIFVEMNPGGRIRLVSNTNTSTPKIISDSQKELWETQSHNRNEPNFYSFVGYEARGNGRAIVNEDNINLYAWVDTKQGGGSYNFKKWYYSHPEILSTVESLAQLTPEMRSQSDLSCLYYVYFENCQQAGNISFPMR